MNLVCIPWITGKLFYSFLLFLILLFLIRVVFAKQLKSKLKFNLQKACLRNELTLGAILCFSRVPPPGPGPAGWPLPTFAVPRPFTRPGLPGVAAAFELRCRCAAASLLPSEAPPRPASAIPSLLYRSRIFSFGGGGRSTLVDGCARACMSRVVHVTGSSAWRGAGYVGSDSPRPFRSLSLSVRWARVVVADACVNALTRDTWLACLLRPGPGPTVRTLAPPLLSSSSGSTTRGLMLGTQRTGRLTFRWHTSCRGSSLCPSCQRLVGNLQGRSGGQRSVHTLSSREEGVLPQHTGDGAVFGVSSDHGACWTITWLFVPVTLCTGPEFYGALM